MRRWNVEDLRPFGPTGQQLIPVGMGSHGLGHAFGLNRDSGDLEKSLRFFSETIPEGGRALVDVAPRYGHGSVESWVGSAVLNPNLLVATKGGRHIEAGRDNEKDFSSTFLRQDLLGSLKRLRLDSVFLYQMHNPSPETVASGGLFSVLEGFRTEGLIEWYGFSVDDAAEAIAVLDAAKEFPSEGLASIQLIHSFLTKFDRTQLSKATMAGKTALIAREVLCRGLLTASSLDFGNPSASAVEKLVRRFGQQQLQDLRQKALRVTGRHQMSVLDAAIGYSLMTEGVSVTLLGVTQIDEARADLQPRSPISMDCFLELDALPDLVPIE